ncbi:SMI1 / KNR4 family protein [Posidoniimonas corsicana]|uniref:SMI1 / KNR4 family protein n=1 Tax=Posidoniimonas corsicana TaxID=1938618 RepID=A0A5C5V444_9BACT|nr:SMI1/KNR4 family protein [Posidoniimonas corsicana]TWT32527.1 SMI1 / KNR4 family protein [Posidoniimonas corsicana]
MPFRVDIRFLKETERKLGVMFPPSYVVRIVKANGGGVEAPPDVWLLYPILDTSDKKRLKRTCNDVVRETESANEWPDFPPSAVAIGGNGTGDQLIFLRQSSDPSLLTHEVYWWDHETGAVEKVADDLGDLPDA